MVLVRKKSLGLETERWHCYACYVLPVLFPPIVRCETLLEDGQCRLVANHPGSCKSDSGSTKTVKATRDGAPKLAAERKRGNLAFQKRHRAGAQWVPHHRRVSA